MRLLGRRVQPRKARMAAIAVIATLIAHSLYVGPAYALDKLSIDPARIHFINEPKNVRADSNSALGAQLVTYEATTKVEFYVDGHTDAPIEGTNYGIAGDGFREWRLVTILTPGDHNITARVMIDENWYDVAGSATVHALDSTELGRDASNPEVTNFASENDPPTQADMTLRVMAEATDGSGVESVSFFLTTHTEGCAGESPKLAELRAQQAPSDGKYRVTFDTAGLTEGTYCITAIARDLAMNESVPRHLIVSIAHAPAPTVSIEGLGDNRTITGFVSTGSATLKVLIDDVSRSDSVMQRDGKKWWFVLPNDITSGTHTVKVSANADGRNSVLASYTFTLSPEIVPGGLEGSFVAQAPDQLLEQLGEELSQPFSVPAAFEVVTPATLASEGDMEILGAQTTLDPTTDQNVKTAAVTATESGWKLFGILWYWWLLAVGGMGVATYQFVARVKKMPLVHDI